MVKIGHKEGINLKDPDFWDEQWQTSRKAETTYTQCSPQSTALWEKQAEHFVANSGDNKRVNDTLTWLASQGVVLNGMNVLDLCSGPGAFTFACSEPAAAVTALEPATAMVNFIRERINRERQKNIHIIQLPWEDVDVEKQGLSRHFDLVLASSCPGIHSIELLEKALLCTTTYFYFYGWAGARENDALDALWRYLYHSDIPSWPDDSLYILNWLHAKRYNFSLDVKEDRRVEESSVEKATKALLFLLDLHGKSVVGLEDQVADFVRQRAKDGIFCQTSISRRARILVTLTNANSG
ncbi:MAG: class I SAM-dependent methyltransferase [Firmicutes bacterium]|nr:class I SAM-dependent methyltransferase [Bacillota bacterium]